jgi:GNAT superfamily N-acetyltransferase
LLVEGFGSPPVLMMTYNPAYYIGLIEGQGFRKAKDLLAYWRGYADVPERLADIAGRLARRHRIVVRPLDMPRFAEEVERVRAIYNAAWEENWGFVPMTDAEIRYMAKKLKPVVDPHLVAFAEVDGELAGFTLALPDLNQALKHAGGRLLPLGWIKILWHARRIDALRVLTLGVLEPYRGTGAAELLILHLLRTGPTRGITKGEFSWILEDNVVMRAALEKMDARMSKVYRLYDRAIVPASGSA